MQYPYKAKEKCKITIYIKKNYNAQNASDWKEKPTKRELRER